MVDNFLPYFDMQEQIDTLPKKNVEGRLETVCSDIASRKTVEIKITAFTKAQMKMYRKMFPEADPDWDMKPDIKWNFTKFVVDREGNVAARFEPTTDIDKVEACIKTLL